MNRQTIEWGTEKTILIKGKPTKTKDIVFDLVESNFYTRRDCHICGSLTEKDYVLCEVTEGEYKGLRVCPRCIKARDFNTRLEETAKRLEQEVSFTRSLIGRLKVPTIDEFNQLTEEIDNKIIEQYEREKINRVEDEETTDIPF